MLENGFSDSFALFLSELEKKILLSPEFPDLCELDSLICMLTEPQRTDFLKILVNKLLLSFEKVMIESEYTESYKKVMKFLKTFQELKINTPDIQEISKMLVVQLYLRFLHKFTNTKLKSSFFQLIVGLRLLLIQEKYKIINEFCVSNSLIIMENVLNINGLNDTETFVAFAINALANLNYLQLIQNDENKRVRFLNFIKTSQKIMMMSSKENCESLESCSSQEFITNYTTVSLFYMWGMCVFDIYDEESLKFVSKELFKDLDSLNEENLKKIFQVFY